MSSSVHFKFKSQKEPSRVTFDGTGISVFELKREIINQSKLGDGSDFELEVYAEDTGEAYDDDTTIIPRSTSVIARRLPAARPGKGGAARYVSGKMPVNARNASRIEPSLTRAAPGLGGSVTNNVLELNNAQTEEEKINALFNLQASQWKEQQQEMANATPVPFGRGRGKPVNVPDHPPPPGYLCYRCREKGHWIQACPTNNDPKFDGKYRVKRSTGIPRSLQTKVDKPDSMASDGTGDDSRNTGVMVNADGDFVVARPDKAAWELYQEKAKASAAAAAEAAAAEESKELQARGLECPIDKRMFLEPTKTPCCQRTYCNDCISNALIESDFVCPGCSTEGVLLDNLTPDDDAVAKIKAYEAEKTEAKKEKERQANMPASPNGSTANGVTANGHDSPKLSTVKERSPSQQPGDSTPKQGQKRSAEDEPARDQTDSPGNVSKKQKSDDHSNTATPSTTSATTTAAAISSTTNGVSKENNGSTPNPNMPFNPQMPFGDFNNMMPGFPNGGFDPNGMPFMNPMGMPNGFPNPMGPGWNPMNMPFPPMQGNMFGNQNAGFPPMFNGDPSMMFGMGGMGNMGNMGGGMPNQNNGFSNQPMNNFANQQRTAFSGPYSREEDSPYFRQPVNPQRHQARNRRVRPSDYREL
ncbi:Zinc knuckle domain-containing protein [Penicillium ucsense]|uniref:Zinc knuckle domain-containing protein n=1 Tax=Penicillium ucsense TaxID=2839758 RepID=A0A8J8WLU8_9EURO|nr:Zinc knuckle domain-containing protein [Penicillium ucsense]KAF7730020.1 Zinc knuckle domain-containing protein [Penicillium ucsense]